MLIEKVLAVIGLLFFASVIGFFILVMVGEDEKFLKSEDKDKGGYWW